MLTIEIKGLDELMDQLGKMEGAGYRSALRSLYRWGQNTMTEAKQRTPVAADVEHGLAPGTLRDSGTVWPAEGDGKDLVLLRLSFGGAASAYAAVQHERLDFYHDVGEAKFLESAVNDNLNTLAEELGVDLEYELRSSI